MRTTPPYARLTDKAREIFIINMQITFILLILKYFNKKNVKWRKRKKTV